MGLLLAFTPFIAFAVVDRLAGSLEGLIAGAVVSATLLLRDFLAADRHPKILEVGTFILFAGMACYAAIADPGWSIMGVRLRVDAGLLAIVVFSLVVGRPFTLQYARERVAPELHDSPTFKATNNVISLGWAVAFAVMIVADLILIYRPDWPPRIGILLTVAALVGAFKFTDWYADRQRTSAATLKSAANRTGSVAAAQHDFRRSSNEPT